VLLSDSRVNPAADNYRAVIVAAEKGNEGVLAIMLKDKRVDPGLMNNCLVIIAATKGGLLM
jgi:hypothetical protein